MELKKIYWRRNALNNLKSILVLCYRRKKLTAAKRLAEGLINDIEAIRKRPYHGYIEIAMQEQGQRQKIYSHLNRKVKILYYTENDALYIIDFQNNY
jgi:plasmid stabilization system protein ParE